ncbi:MAG: peptidoglycan D,D-transpeptidase FtsI family protein, partial [Candidatus Kapaibacteriota bacterium]
MVDYPKELDTFSFPGLISLTEPKRFYLYGSSVSNLIGLTNLDNVGIAGIEYFLDSILKGTDGFSYFLKDALGRLVPDIELPSEPAIDGRSIRLTIDINLQRLVSYFLKMGVQETAAKGGCIIALNPKTGEILAMANFPNFDPANTAQLSNENLINYAVNFAFEPGSTLKPIIAAIGLESNIISESQLFNGYNGKFTLGNVSITDEHPFSMLTLKDALTFSSNIVFAQIAALIPNEILEQGLKKLGFGCKTGIPFPGELKGYITREDSLSLVQRMFIGYGYGIYATPLQVAMAYCAIANSGLLPKAKLLFKDLETSPIDTVFQKETTDILKNYLVDVVNIGTAVGTKVDGITIAGKTGTSQKFEQGKYSKTLYTNTFVGFLPAENPKFLMLILLDEPKNSIYASNTVVPLFRKIVLAITNSKLSSYIYSIFRYFQRTNGGSSA